MISCVIPAYNEENAIEQTVAEVKAALSALENCDYEIIVVDDGSTDETRRHAEATDAVVISHLNNLGYGRSLKDGIRQAKGEDILILDADGTYPPEAIPELWAEYVKGYDMVVGARQGKHYKGGKKKQIGRYFLRKLVEFTTDRNVPDVNSGFRFFKRSSAMPFLNRLCDGFSFTTSITLNLMMDGRQVAYVPIRYDQRIGKTKVRMFKDTLRTLQYILQALIYFDPLRVFLLTALASVGLSVFFFVFGLLTGAVSGYHLSMGSAIMAIMVFALGLLADLLKQIMDK